MDLLITVVLSVVCSVAAVRYIWGAPRDVNSQGATKDQWMDAERETGHPVRPISAVSR
jgi:hypothetical protein